MYTSTKLSFINLVGYKWKALSLYDHRLAYNLQQSQQSSHALRVLDWCAPLYLNCD